MLPGTYSTPSPTLFGLPLHGLLSDKPGYQYPSTMSLSPIVQNADGSIAGITAPGIVRSTAQGLLQGIQAPNQVRQGKMDPMTGAMLTAGAAPVGSLLVPKPVGPALGMNVFHGTPHKFAPEPDFPQGRPRMDKMGTGEGAQAYGPGFYSADQRNVADHYAPRDLDYEDAVAARYEQAQNAQDYTAMSIWEDALLHETPNSIRARYADPDYDAATRETANRVADELAQIPLSSSVYKLDIPDADAAKLLDYDAPISQQPQVVRDAIDRLGFMPDNPDKTAGGDVWFFMRQQLGENEAATAMRGAGVPGLRYMDAGSRGTDSASGARNFVVWDQDVLDRTQMLQRNDEAVFSNPAPAAIPGLLMGNPAITQQQMQSLLADPYGA